MRDPNRNKKNFKDRMDPYRAPNRYYTEKALADPKPEKNTKKCRICTKALQPDKYFYCQSCTVNFINELDRGF